MTGRLELLGWLADRIGALPPHPSGVIRVGIDGADGAGKTRFAADLAAELTSRGRPVIVASVDGFHHPRAVRYRQGRDSPAGYYENSYDYARLRADLLNPLSPGGSRWYRPSAFDHRRDTEVVAPPRFAPADAVLIMDGIFLHRPEIARYWDFSVFLRADAAVRFARMAGRDGCPPDPDHPDNQRYHEGQRIYFDRVRPEARASVVIDHNDPAAPVLVAIDGVAVGETFQLS
ncbi:MAG TPA: uridine kinase [Micromonosporaceae bacterium]